MTLLACNERFRLGSRFLYDPVNGAGLGSDNMKPFLFAFAFGALAHSAVADPLDTLVPAYEAYVDAASPEDAAREENRAPDRWADVKPATITAQAEAARAVKGQVYVDAEPDASPEAK